MTIEQLYAKLNVQQIQLADIVHYLKKISETLEQLVEHKVDLGIKSMAEAFNLKTCKHEHTYFKYGREVCLDCGGFVD